MFGKYDWIFLPFIRKAIEEKKEKIQAYALVGDQVRPFIVTLGDLTDDEREIILSGCLINYYKNH